MEFVYNFILVALPIIGLIFAIRLYHRHLSKRDDEIEERLTKLEEAIQEIRKKRMKGY
jgi:hypothetical protein